MGFESFEDSVLRNLNKGLSTEANLDAVRLMRELKEEFPDVWGYSSSQGAIHGFIHPTPWDTDDISRAIRETMMIYGLPGDIIPAHSTPLIIHHASALGDWIREVEVREGLELKRYGTVIGWWDL